MVSSSVRILWNMLNRVTAASRMGLSRSGCMPSTTLAETPASIAARVIPSSDWSTNIATARAFGPEARAISSSVSREGLALSIGTTSGLSSRIVRARSFAPDSTRRLKSPATAGLSTMSAARFGSVSTTATESSFFMRARSHRIARAASGGRRSSRPKRDVLKTRARCSNNWPSRGTLRGAGACVGVGRGPPPQVPALVSRATPNRTSRAARAKRKPAVRTSTIVGAGALSSQKLA